MPSFLGTEASRAARSTFPVNPAAEPFFDGRSGLATLLATYVGSSLSAALPDVVPSRDSLSEPPQAESSGIPPATAAVATAVEARKLLRLGPSGPEEGAAAFGVIASTLHGAPGHPAVEPSAVVS